MPHRLSVAAFLICVSVVSLLLIYRSVADSAPESASLNVQGHIKVTTAHVVPNASS